MAEESADLRKEIDKLMIFFKSRDFNQIDSGIELIRGMEDPSIFEVLLDACSINNEGKFVINSLFSSNGIEQPYLDYTLLNLIAYAPEDSKLDDSLKRSNIESLDLDFNGQTYYVQGGEPFDFDDIQIGYFVSLPDCISSLTKLTKLSVLGGPLQNANALVNCYNLAKLELAGCDSLKNVDFLPKLPNLTDLTLGFRRNDCAEEIDDEEIWEIVGESSIENIDGIYSCSQLKRLTIERADFDIDSSKLSKLSNLTHLGLEECAFIYNLDGLSNLTNLNSLSLRFWDEEGVGENGYVRAAVNQSGGDSWTVETDDRPSETIPNYEAVLVLVRKLLK